MTQRQQHYQVFCLQSLQLQLLEGYIEDSRCLVSLGHVNFLQVLSRDHVRMLVWERGAGKTLACGTGACAAVVAGVLEGKVDRNCRSVCRRSCLELLCMCLYGIQNHIQTVKSLCMQSEDLRGLVKYLCTEYLQDA